MIEAAGLYRRNSSGAGGGGDLPMLVDLGANVGSHALSLARLGYPVWAAETLTQNINRIFAAALMSYSLPGIRLFRNAVGVARGRQAMQSVVL